MQIFDLNNSLDVVQTNDDADTYVPPSAFEHQPGIIETAFMNVKFGDVGTSGKFLQAVFAAHPNLNDLMDQTDADEFVWRGRIKNAPGAFFTVGTYDSNLADSAGEYGTGLGDNVRTQCVLSAEIDENHDGTPISINDQCRLWDATIALGLPIPNAVVLSGGKSVHVHWAVTGLSANRRHRQESWLLALTGADPSVGTPGHKFRLGGHSSGGRVQTNLYLHYKPTSADAMTIGLSAVATAWGYHGDSESILKARSLSRAIRSRTGSTKATGSTSGTSGTIDPNAVIRSVSYGTGTIESLSSYSLGSNPIKVFCPFHHHNHNVDNSHNATIGRTSKGTPWLHCFGKCGGVTYWQPKPIKDQTECDQSIDELLDQMLGGLDGDTSAHTKDDEQTEEILVKRAEMRDGYLEFTERIEARRKASDDVDQDVKAAAAAVFKSVLKLSSKFRKKYKDAGCLWAPCGHAQGMINMESFEHIAHWRCCKVRKCGRCGPWVMAMQYVALVDMPVVINGKIVGLSLAKRNVLYIYQITPGKFESFQRAFRRACPISSLERKDTKEEIGQAAYERDPDNHNAYVSFQTNSGYTVATTMEINSQSIIKDPGHSEQQIHGEVNIREWLLNAVDNTYQVTVDEFNITEVSGKITTSRGLILNPAEIRGLAAVHQVVVVEPGVDMRKFTKKATELNLKLKESREEASPYGKFLCTVKTNPIYDLEQSRALFAAAKDDNFVDWSKKSTTANTADKVDQQDMEDLINSMLNA